MLAVSAACMCCDMIEKKPRTSTNAVNQLLMAGYRHYNLASEKMRETISRQDPQAQNHLLASAVLLVPFATASQQINHWISRRSKGESSTKRLTTTPRDAMILVRGIRTTLQTLHSGDLVSSLKLAKESAVPACNPSAVSNISSALPPSRTHPMFAIVANTSKSAFSKLQERLDSVSSQCSDRCGDDLLACTAAFATLDRLRMTAFSSAENAVESAPIPLPQMPSWLRSFANRAANPLPHESLTSFFFSFLVHAPQVYLDLMLPLLDQRLESPMDVSSKVSRVVKLTAVQAIALNIYAYWSVFMLLVEKDSWWIGNLPEVTLTAMVNTYGDNFVTKLDPKSDSEPEKWWPEVMLNILREVKRFQWSSLLILLRFKMRADLIRKTIVCIILVCRKHHHTITYFVLRLSCSSMQVNRACLVPGHATTVLALRYYQRHHQTNVFSSYTHPLISRAGWQWSHASRTGLASRFQLLTSSDSKWAPVLLGLPSNSLKESSELG